MESEPSPSSLSSVITKDEFEVTEFDTDALWELLHDEPGREEEAGRTPTQAMEVIELNPNSVVERYWCVDNSNNNTVEDVNWFRIMEETSLGCIDMWYGEPCICIMEEEITQTVEIGGGHYPFSHTAILFDEIGYIGLWHHT